MRVGWCQWQRGEGGHMREGGEGGGQVGGQE